MKFVVQKGYGNEVDVKLHWESKDKIKRIVYWTYMGTCAAAVGAYFATKKKQAPIEE